MDVFPASLLTNLSLQLGQFPSGLEDAVEAINNPINGFAWGWPTVCFAIQPPLARAKSVHSRH